MNAFLIDHLACPRDGHFPLQLQGATASGGQIMEGDLACESCGSRFEIVAGIPHFLLLDSDEVSELKRREMAARDESYRTGSERSELDVDRLSELSALRSALGPCHGLRVLDAGCGAGQMTRVASDAAQVVGLDYGWEGLVQHRFHGASTLDLVRGDVCRMPFRGGVFDASISSQVIEHVPTEEQRRAFLAELARSLKPGGRLAITAYNWDRVRRARGIPKEGLHESGIFYHCYEEEELRSELEACFEVQAIWGVDVYLPNTYRLVKTLGRHYVHWDRFWRVRRASIPHSKLLLARCRRRA